MIYKSFSQTNFSNRETSEKKHVVFGLEFYFILFDFDRKSDDNENESGLSSCYERAISLMNN